MNFSFRQNAPPLGGKAAAARMLKPSFDCSTRFRPAKARARWTRCDPIPSTAARPRHRIRIALWRARRQRPKAGISSIERNAQLAGNSSCPQGGCPSARATRPTGAPMARPVCTTSMFAAIVRKASSTPVRVGLRPTCSTVTSLSGKPQPRPARKLLKKDRRARPR